MPGRPPHSLKEGARSASGGSLGRRPAERPRTPRMWSRWPRRRATRHYLRDSPGIRVHRLAELGPAALFGRRSSRSGLSCALGASSRTAPYWLTTRAMLPSRLDRMRQRSSITWSAVQSSSPSLVSRERRATEAAPSGRPGSESKCGESTMSTSPSPRTAMYPHDPSLEVNESESLTPNEHQQIAPALTPASTVPSEAA